MSRSKAKLSARIGSGLVEVKSRFDAEFRRFSVSRQTTLRFDDFYRLVEEVHCLQSVPFIITYTDPEGDLLPINNDDNFAVAFSSAQPVLRLHIQQKGQSVLEVSGYGTVQRRRNKLSKFVPTSTNDVRSPQVVISLPEDFRRVSAIIDVDVVPATQRRVRLMKSGVDANKPLGFYIRDGASIRVTPAGVEKVPAIFISRLVPGGIAESTGLLAVNDEVMEVNGIEVAGKTLDQVTDMMVANSANMIITVKPANQNNNIQRRAVATGKGSAVSAVPVRMSPLAATASDSHRLGAAAGETNLALVENDDEDEVREYAQESPRSSRDPSESGGFPRAAWGSQNIHADSEAGKISSVSPQSSDSDDVTERLNGISLQNDKPSSTSHDQDKLASAPGTTPSLHETPTKMTSNDADEIRAEELNVAKNASKSSSNPEGKPSVRVVFTPIEDL